MIYLDYAATTPVDQEVARVMAECLTVDSDFANPASSHTLGQRARARVETARGSIAESLNVEPRSIVWTSGATEADNLAILGAARFYAERRGKHIVSVKTEHRAVVDACKALEQQGFEVSWVDVDKHGLVSTDALKNALRDDTVLASIMHVNNETGVRQDIAALGAVCRDRGVLFHVDAAQSFGKCELDLSKLPIDLLSISGHKIYGPKGVGALYVRQRPRVWLQPLQYGGGHERGLRSGTLPTHQVCGFAKAAELMLAERQVEQPRLAALRERLWSRVSAVGGVYLNGHPQQCVAGILSISIAGVHGEALVAGLHDIALSTGSACSSADREPSYVLRALGRDDVLAEASLRLSLGRFTTESDIDAAASRIVGEITRLRALAPRQVHGGKGL